MKNIIFPIIASIILSTSCSDNSNNTMYVQGEIKGLKKGTLYLQNIVDGVLADIDSINVEGDATYAMESSVNTNELYFLTLDKNKEKTIPFFGEIGTIIINTVLDKFALQAKISGSKNQEILDKYNKIASEFQYQNLELIKENFEAKKAKDQKKLDALAKKSRIALRKKYLYTTNFAIINADSEVAPYLALTKLSDANIKLLDTINNSLSEEIKNSRYGKELNSFIEKIKATEIE